MRIAWHIRSAAGTFAVGVAIAGGSLVAANQTPATSAPIIPEKTAVIEGVPTVRVDTTADGVTRRQLGRSEASTQPLKISVVDGHFLWSSRDNQPLTLSSSGEFVYLSSAQPGRYVRFTKVRDKIFYVEHVDLKFGSVTYWGELRFILK